MLPTAQCGRKALRTRSTTSSWRPNGSSLTPRTSRPCGSTASTLISRPGRRREICHFAGALSSSRLKHLLNKEGAAAE